MRWATLHLSMGKVVEYVSDRLQEDKYGKPPAFRNPMIENTRGPVDGVPRLNVFGDDEFARLCEQLKDHIASFEPDAPIGIPNHL